MLNLEPHTEANKTDPAEVQSGHLPDGSPSKITILPPEILEQVFEICTRRVLLSYPSRGHESPTPYRLAFSQTCRRWRTIALNFNALWRWIDIANSQLAKEFLLRSGSGDLDIFATFSSSPLTKHCAEELRIHARRIKSINISFGPDNARAVKSLFHHIEADLINLTSLSLYAVALGRGAPRIFVNLASATPLNILELHGVAVPKNGFGRSMKLLALKGIDSRYSPTRDDLALIFQSIPHLEDLSFRRISIPQSPNPPPMIPVALASLREVFIEGESLIRTILPLISFPLSTRIQLDFPKLVPISQGLLRDLESCTLLVQNDSIKLLPPAVKPTKLDTALYRRGLSDVGPMTFFSDLHVFFDAPRFTALELAHDIFLFISPRCIIEFLARFTNLETLRIACDMIRQPKQILSALLARSSSAPLSSAGPIGDHGEPVCPHLRTVFFDRDNYGLESPIDVGSPALAWLESLVALAQAREQALVPLAVLVFYFWVPEEIVEKLREYGAVVRVLERAHSDL